MKQFRILLAAAVFAVIASPAPVFAEEGDSHALYHYPKPQTRETYATALTPLPTANKRTRVGFTVGLNAAQEKLGYAPGYHIFAKGAHGQKMIIVATGQGKYDTLYRLRALLAALSANARRSPLFSQAPEPENLNFLDLARLVGFERVTLSDGDKIAHRIDLR